MLKSFYRKAIGFHFEMQWENLLAVKISHAISVIVGLQLPYSVEERFSFTFAIYALLVHLTGVIRQTVTVMTWYLPTEIPLNFTIMANLGLGVISGKKCHYFIFILLRNPV